MVCGSEVERKNIQQEFNSTTLILLVICYLPPTVWRRQMMCGSEVERKNIQEFYLTKWILLVCICYLPPTVWRRQMIYVVVKWRGTIYNKSSI